MISRVIIRNKVTATSLTTKSSINAFLNTRVWLVTTTVAESQYPISVADDTVDKMISLSGFSNCPPTLDSFIEVKQALERQMKFIYRLYDSESASHQCESNNEGVFRLIASDFIPPTPLTLSDLTQQINELQPQPQKGELGFDISSIGNHTTHFTVNTQ